jgi:hypothetical protein
MSRSNLTDAIAAIDRCSEDELRQIQALIGVRLNEKPAGKTRGPLGQKADGGKRGKTSKDTTKGKPKGNPRRKSQFATHPVYKIYKDTKAAVEAESKKQKVSFKDVVGTLSDNYKEALSNWLQTKSGFRASKTDHENPDSKSEEANSDKRGGSGPDGTTSNHESRDAIVQSEDDAETENRSKRPRIEQKVSAKTQESPRVGKYSLPPEWWVEQRDGVWTDLNSRERKSAWKQSPDEMRVKG